MLIYVLLAFLLCLDSTYEHITTSHFKSVILDAFQVRGIEGNHNNFCMKLTADNQ